MRFASAAISIMIVAGCAASSLIDPGHRTWSGRLTCTGLTTAECNAGEQAVLEALGAEAAGPDSIDPGEGSTFGPPLSVRNRQPF